MSSLEGNKPNGAELFQEKARELNKEMSKNQKKMKIWTSCLDKDLAFDVKVL